MQFENAVASVEANADLIVLETADGKAVSKKLYSVSLPDMELEFGYRQYVWIDVDGLDAGTAYRIHVLPGVTAKNGMVNPDEAVIEFKTAASGKKATALAEPGAVEGGTGGGGGNGGGAVGAGSAGSAGGSAAGGDEGSGEGLGSEPVVIDAKGNVLGDDAAEEPEPVDPRLVVAVVAVIAVVAAGLVFDVKRRRKNVAKR
ncbi:MAG: hypothetical protein ACI36Y_00895 [Coriobacteriales bacterium]